MLNDAKLRAAQPREKAYKLTDSHRLYLLVTPSGGKLWRWNYTYDSKQKSLSFGSRSRQEAQNQGHIEVSRNTFERVTREWHQANAPNGRKSTQPA